MPNIELVEDHYVNAIGCFIVKQCVFKSENLRFVSVDSKQEDGTYCVLVPGTGVFEFIYNDQNFQFIREPKGEPVTSRLSSSNTSIHESVSVSGASTEALDSLLKSAIQSLDIQVTQKLTTYIWDAGNEHWRRDSISPFRNFDSVILDPKTKQLLTDDLNEFVSKETNAWYTKHSIPFKRGILLYGPPGTGKTSTIMAIASTLNRKIYRVNLVAPRLCDNSLLMAMNDAKNESIVVMEDVDALFGKFRDKKEEFAVTFSGLLNAIDGIGDTTRGMIFIFTSNHPERLDPALRRKGRVDLELQLTYCTNQQCKDMFLRFYPDENEAAAMFAKNVSKHTNKASPAQLQHHFISMRKKSAKEAADIDLSIFTIDEHDSMWN